MPSSVLDNNYPPDLGTMAAVPLELLEPGSILDCDVFSGDTLLLGKGSKISPGIIQRLRHMGISSVAVSLDSALAQHARQAHLNEQDKALAAVLEDPNPTYALHGVELAIPQAFLEETTNQIEASFTSLEAGQPLDIEPMRETVRQMVQLVGERPGGAIKLLDLDRFDRYTYRHSINVALLYLLNAQTWAVDEELLSEEVLGALLHDIGKMRVGLEIINKPGRLTDDEMSRMRNHPLWGIEILEKDQLSESAREIIIGHHERMDGRGYPYGRFGHELSSAARMSAVCDVYDALTTSRSYKGKMNFSEAIDIIIQSAGAHFDSELTHLFITKVGRHPIGTFVQLSSGEVAVVIRLNPRSLARPIVSRVLKSGGEAFTAREEFDLSQHPQLRIQRIVSPGELTREAA